MLAFTFTDARYDRSLSDPELPAGSDVRKMLERNRVKNTSRDIDQIVQRACEAKWCLLIDEELYVEPGDEFSHQQRRGQPDESYCTYLCGGLHGLALSGRESASTGKPGMATLLSI